jgi:hypothetical protein
MDTDDTAQHWLDRRGFLRVGGLTITGAVVLAACGGDDEGTTQIPVAGESPGYVPLDQQTVDDNVLLRTATGFEGSLVDAYQKLLQNNFLTDPQIVSLVQTFQAHHIEHATTLAAATTANGGVACTPLQPNAKITDHYLQPVLQAIAASPARNEDAKAFVAALENLAAATHQALVQSLSQPALRHSVMSIGGVEARHAAIVAAVINPEDLVGTVAPVEDAAAPEGTPATTLVTGLPTTAPGAATTTTLPAATAENQIVAIPTAFGFLGVIPLIVGPPDENGVRETFNFETPSLNSLLYEGETC